MSAPPALRAGSAIRRVAGWALAAVGPMAGLGYLLHLPALVALGTLSAASPLPIVFGAVSGHEYWATRYELDVEMRDGRREHREVARGHFGRLGGPHRARMLLALPLVLAPVLPDDAWMRPVAAGLCHGGRLARVLDLDGAVRHMEVTAIHRDGATRGERHYGVWCPDR
jgi:hypothetical protein